MTEHFGPDLNLNIADDIQICVILRCQPDILFSILLTSLKNISFVYRREMSVCVKQINCLDKRRRSWNL